MAALKEADRRALVAYIVAGDGGAALTVAAMHALVEAGADILELGVPFSDPMAEGPPIQRGMERALARGTTVACVLEMAAEFRRRDKQTPLVLMGYANPFLQFGYRDFAAAAARAGADGVLVVDMPAEDAQELAATLQGAGLDMIFLASPTTAKTRLKTLAALCRGYLYCVSLKGVTGADSLDAAAVEKRLAVLRREVSLPLCVGFGIKTPALAARLARAADGVVLGSLLVDTMGALTAEEDDTEAIARRLGETLLPYRRAVDNTAPAKR